MPISTSFFCFVRSCNSFVVNNVSSASVYLSVSVCIGVWGMSVYQLWVNTAPGQEKLWW